LLLTSGVVTRSSFHIRLERNPGKNRLTRLSQLVACSRKAACDPKYRGEISDQHDREDAKELQQDRGALIASKKPQVEIDEAVRDLLGEMRLEELRWVGSIDSGAGASFFDATDNRQTPER